MTQLLNDFLSGSAAWGVLLTLAAFALGALINKLTGKAIFNPLLLGSIFVIVFLSVCKIPYADYKVSAAPVNYLLLPATVALAIPLYEKIDLLKKNADALKMGTIETARESQRGVVDIETLQQTNKSLIETLDELNKIQTEGRAKRVAAEQELTRIEDELKQKMMEIRS